VIRAVNFSFPDAVALVKENGRIMADEADSPFMTIQELSDYVKIKVKTLYAMVPLLPRYKVGRLIRFRRDEIDEWMRSRRVSFREEESKEPKERDENAGKKEKGDAKGNDAQKRRPRKAGRPTMTRDTDVDRLVRRSIDEFKGRKRRGGSN
jgi:excisionase family DNA binding protein